MPKRGGVGLGVGLGVGDAAGVAAGLLLVGSGVTGGSDANVIDGVDGDDGDDAVGMVNVGVADRMPVPTAPAGPQALTMAAIPTMRYRKAVRLRRRGATEVFSDLPGIDGLFRVVPSGRQGAPSRIAASPADR